MANISNFGIVGFSLEMTTHGKDNTGEARRPYINDNQQMKSSLDSVVTNRHSIAHGQASSLTLKSVRQYFDDVKKIITELDKIISK